MDPLGEGVFSDPELSPYLTGMRPIADAAKRMINSNPLGLKNGKDHAAWLRLKPGLDLGYRLKVKQHENFGFEVRLGEDPSTGVLKSVLPLCFPKDITLLILPKLAVHGVVSVFGLQNSKPFGNCPSSRFADVPFLSVAPCLLLARMVHPSSLRRIHGMVQGALKNTPSEPRACESI